MQSGPNFFELLGLEQRYDLDLGEIEGCYRERSKEVHPDRHVGKDAGERVKALQASMTVNEAYKTLKKPGSRAEYLLSLHGVVIADNERIQPGLIVEILEAREELAAALAKGDQDKLDELEEAMLDRREQNLERVARLFAELPAAPPEEALLAIKSQLILLRYIDRYLEQFDLEDDQAA